MINIADDKKLRSRVLAALADGTRAEIVELLAARPRPAGEIHGAFPIADPAVSRHLRVLRDAGLVEERRRDDDHRVRIYSLRPQPLEQVARWLEQTATTWQAQLDSFKDYVEVRTR
jgi:DNA-binding transcriptional ArsR family regulator